MIDDEFTQFEVRLEGGLRTITIPMDPDLLMDTEEVVPTLGPLCSDIECKTLKKIIYSALSRSIVSLALRVSIYYMNFSNFLEHSKF